MSNRVPITAEPTVPAQTATEISPGPDGQFLGGRRVITLEEQRKAFRIFLAKSQHPLTPECRAVACSTWYAAIAFTKLAGYEGYDAALAALNPLECQEDAPRT